METNVVHEQKLEILAIIIESFRLIGSNISEF